MWGANNMCIMIGHIIGAKLPDEATLDACASANRDGVGIAYTLGDGVVHIKKDFVSHWTFKWWFKENINKEHSFVAHYRMATSGKKDCGNAHPFPISSDKKLLRQTEIDVPMAVAHNGVFPGKGGEKYSDTQEFIANILADPAVADHLDAKSIRTLISAFIGSSRLFIIDGEGNITHYGDIEREGEGLFYSNKQYKTNREDSKKEFDYMDGYYGRDSEFYNTHHWDRALSRYVPNNPLDIKKDIEEVNNRFKRFCDLRHKTEDEKNPILLNFTKCFICKGLEKKDNLLTVARKHNSELMRDGMCKKCFYTDGLNKAFYLVEKEGESEILTISDAQKEINNAQSAE